MHNNAITYIGETDIRGETRKFGIFSEDRTRHIYVIGRTGVGKSKFLEGLAIQDIHKGEGLIFMDPHGSSVDEIRSFIPENRVQDVIDFRVHDYNYPIGFNIMEDIGYDKRHLVVSGLMSAFKKIWGEDSWSSRMEQILSNTLLTLLEYPNTTLLDINRMYARKDFREEVLSYVKDPQVLSFWRDEYDRLTDRTAAEATPAIQNKIGQFTSNPLIRNIIAQPKSSFNFREVMDSRKILLINLSKGLIGDQNAQLLGVLFSTKIYLSALSRASASKEEMSALPPCQFYVDEFQSFANESFASILSEARKYKLNLVLTHQYINQMPEEVRDAVFGNVGTLISFRVGPLDSELLSKAFGATQISPDSLSELGKRQMYISLMIDGTPSSVFLARSIDAPITPIKTYEEEVIQHTRDTYAKKREEMEEMIRDRIGTETYKEAQNKSGKKKKNNQKKQHTHPQGQSKPQYQSQPKPQHQTNREPHLQPQDQVKLYYHSQPDFQEQTKPEYNPQPQLQTNREPQPHTTPRHDPQQYPQHHTTPHHHPEPHSPHHTTPHHHPQPHTSPSFSEKEYSEDSDAIKKEISTLETAHSNRGEEESSVLQVYEKIMQKKKTFPKQYIKRKDQYEKKSVKKERETDIHPAPQAQHIVSSFVDEVLATKKSKKR